MSKKQLFYRNQISVKHLDKKYLSNLSKKFNNIFPNIVNEINNDSVSEANCFCYLTFTLY